MPNLPPPPTLGAELYSDLCNAIKDPRDWSASPLEIETVRKAILNRERIDVLTYEERELISRIAERYRAKTRAGRNPTKRTSPATAPSRTARPDRDLAHLSFLADSLPDPDAESSPPSS